MRTLYMNTIGAEKRIALYEEEKAAEFFFQRPDEDEIVRNIYWGRVTRVLPGMQAAFVDIGIEKQAYLHRNDIAGAEKNQSISQLLVQGQAILVQVVKNAIDTKGPKLTTKIELTGMYAVYMPGESILAVSRNIGNSKKRKELEQLGHRLGGSFIFRTACKDGLLESIQSEIEKLKELYESMWHYKGKVPMLIHTAQSFLDRVLQEIPAHTISQVYLDDYTCFKEVAKKVGNQKVQMYNEKESIFNYFHVEQELELALKKVVWLRNGSYLLIEQMETLTAIDVNTGKYTGKMEQEDTILQTNLYAATEIARQLRLRDIGGMIAIDFINMKDDRSKEQVKHALLSALQNDGTTTRVFSFTALGILEMTRKRKRKSLRDYLLAPCECCKSGFIVSADTDAYRLQRELLQYKGTDYEAVLVEASVSLQEKFDALLLQSTLPMNVIFKTAHVHHYDIRFFGTKKEVQERKSKGVC